ncbi:MAG: hypothetical protein ABIL70_03765 [candidate division WOR-3 bacterium]
MADSYFKSALKIFEELKQPFGIARAYFYYGEYCSAPPEWGEGLIKYLQNGTLKKSS